MSHSLSEHWQFEKKLIALVLSDQQDDAATLIERARNEAFESGDQEHLEQVLSLGMHIYCIMNPPRIADAERFAAEAEKINRSGYRRLQTAQMKYWSTDDIEGAITKAQEAFEIASAEADESTMYTALAIRGVALLDVGRVNEANHLLDRIVAMVDERRRIVVGDETYFLEKMLPPDKAATAYSASRASSHLIVEKKRSPSGCKSLPLAPARHESLALDLFTFRATMLSTAVVG